jgi:ribosomal protein S18 acetylase RimI-like enzyme
MNINVLSIEGLPLVSEIIELHNLIWDNSVGIIELLKNSSRCLYVRKTDGLAGYAFLEEDQSRGFVELQDVVVAPKFRGQGIGKALIKEAMRLYPCIKLIARAYNEPLIRLYRDLGFVEEYTIENYYAIGADGLRMSWPGNNRKVI